MITKLEEIKTGMHVLLRDGNEYLVLKDCAFKNAENVLISLESFDWLNFSYNENFEYVNKRGERTEGTMLFDIMEVYSHPHCYSALDKEGFSIRDEMEEVKPEYIVWKRPQPRKMTKSEIENILGYKIEIVD